MMGEITDFSHQVLNIVALLGMSQAEQQLSVVVVTKMRMTVCCECLASGLCLVWSEKKVILLFPLAKNGIISSS